MGFSDNLQMAEIVTDNWQIVSIFFIWYLFLLYFKFNFADLEECTTNTHNCDVNTDCVNTVGSYSCICRAGYTGDGQTCNGKIQTNKQTYYVSSNTVDVVLNLITFNNYEIFSVWKGLWKTVTNLSCAMRMLLEKSSTDCNNFIFWTLHFEAGNSGLEPG